MMSNLEIIGQEKFRGLLKLDDAVIHNKTFVHLNNWEMFEWETVWKLQFKCVILIIKKVIT